MVSTDKKDEADVSVIICTYSEQRWTDLASAVESVKQQTAPPLEIIVVVDHNPRLLEKARATFTAVVTIPNAGSRGLADARNSGVVAAHGALVAFLDDDAIAATDWLERLARPCHNATVLGSGGTVQPIWVSGRPAWFPPEFYWVVGCTYRGMPMKTGSIRNLYGGCLCIRRDILVSLGGFRPGIGRVGSKPLGCEETELCIRARKEWPTGIFAFEPQATIYHKIRKSRTRWTYFCSRCFAEGISKALLSHLVGMRSGLASERAYVARTLPNGIVHALADFLSRGAAPDLLRAGAIVVGLVTTTAGYVTGRLRYSAHRKDAATGSDLLAR